MPEVNLFVIGDPGYRKNVLERHVAEPMESYRWGQLPLPDGAAIPLDVV